MTDIATYRDLADRLLRWRGGDDATATLAVQAGGIIALGRDYGANLLPCDRLQVLTSAVAAAIDARVCRVLVRQGGDVATLRMDGSVLAIRPEVELGGASRAALVSGKPVLVADAAWDGTFQAATDQPEEPVLVNLLCVPLKDAEGRTEGVLQLGNKLDGFDHDDAEAVGWAAPWLLQHARLAAAPAATLDDGDAADGPGDGEAMPLDAALANLLDMAVDLIDVDRGAIFLHDPDSGELHARVVAGAGARPLRVSARLGLAGTAFLTGEAVVANDAPADRRYHPGLDRREGYHTRNALCVPFNDGNGRRLGVIQLLNKREGGFGRIDRRRLEVVGHQVAAAVDTWRVFNHMAEVKSFNENILRSLSNGVLTVDTSRTVTFVNEAALRILRRSAEDLLESSLAEVFGNSLNAWLLEIVDEVAATQAEKTIQAAEVDVGDDQWAAVNITVIPLKTEASSVLGYIMVFEDVTREQAFRRTISRYVSDKVVDTLIDSEGKGLEGTQQTVSVLFSDIRSFTTLTEAIGPSETVALLNEYFSFMEDVVSNRAGIIDKYIGDALMALFGAPASAGNDADNAVTTAVDMFQVLRLFNQRRAGRGDPIRIGIGIATGPVITGNIGSSKRLDFTAIGNPVNLSSRLESLTKYYGADVMVCGETFDALARPFRHRKVDVIRVRGQQSVTAIYEILDHKRPDELPRNMDELFGLYAEGLETYLAGDWETALKRFQTCLRLDDKDQPSRVMVLRCRQLIANPPESWENVWTYN